MANAIFNARFIPSSSTQISVDTFDVQGTIFDGNGMFSAADAQINDMVFLDCFGSMTAPGTISRYKVIQINSAVGFNLNVRLRYADSGVVVDPAEVPGSAGFICRSSLLRELSYHAAPTIHTFPDYVVQYSRNIDNYTTLENDLNAINDSLEMLDSEFLNDTGSTIDGLTPVKQLVDGSIDLIDPSVEADIKNLLGVVEDPITDGNKGLVIFSGLIKSITTSFTIGDVIYLSKTGTLTNVVPDIGSEGFQAGDFVVKIGQIVKNKDNPAHKDLLVLMELRGQL